MAFLPAARPNISLIVWLILAIGVVGCETRDRLLFPGDPGGDIGGPVSTIDVPGSDTTVAAGPNFTVTGLVTDANGIDTIYFETVGGVSAFVPEVEVGTSFRFGLPITTNDLSGTVITIRVFATDADGNRGDTASRVLTVQ
jgi:hypothetical protein